MGGYVSRRVLIADDEALVSKVIARQIARRLGAQVAEVTDGQAALDLLARESFDVLITDMIMPGLHGLELLQTIVSRHPKLRIIVITGYPENFPYVDVINAGASDFIGKPHNPEELEAKVVRLFRELELLDEFDRERRRIEEDNQKLREARAAQSLAEHKYRSVFEYSMNGMFLLRWDDFEVIEANRAVSVITRMRHSDLVGSSFLELLSAGCRARFSAAFKLFAESGQGTLSDISLANIGEDEVSLDISVSFIDVEDERLILVICKDATEHFMLQRQLEEIAATDSLTGLFNQRSFYTKLEMCMQRALREGIELSLVFIDIDNFKRCNDTYGHQAGDDLLREMGRLIRSQIREGRDFAFRYGGDEFTIVLMGAKREVAQRIAERIRVNFMSENRCETSMSLGIAMLAMGMEVADVIKAADSALYRSKAAGKNTISFA